MSKSQQLDLQIQFVAQQFGQPYDFTEAMLNLHEIQLPLPKYRHPDDGLSEFYSLMTGFMSTEPSLTQQQFTEQADPNFIMDRVRRGQDISVALSKVQPQYGDFTNMPTSYHEALNTITAANSAFNQLDARLRARFENDPGKFLEFVNNPENIEELYDLGIAVKPAEQTPPAANPSPAAVNNDGGGEGA